jgi:hypothetical protein
MLNWLPEIANVPAATWWDVLDIAIVTVVIYEVLKAIRGTRAIQMAAGSTLLVFMFYVSRWGHLQTIDWLIRNLLPYIVFAAIVLFQADIRRALAHFGRAPFFRYFLTPEGAEETIEEIAVAATQLSIARIGAIVVIERQIGTAQLYRGRASARCHADLRSARQHLSAEVAAARRRGDRAERSSGRGSLLSTVDDQPAARQKSRHAASRRDRADRGKRCGRGDCVGGDRAYQRGARWQDRRALRRRRVEAPVEGTAEMSAGH